MKTIEYAVRNITTNEIVERYATKEYAVETAKYVNEGMGTKAVEVVQVITTVEIIPVEK